MENNQNIQGFNGITIDLDKLNEQLDLAQCGMSGVRVAACVGAANKKGETKTFYGCNLEVSRGNVYHAEETALIKALTKGYTELYCVALTSNNPKYLVPLCYRCRSIFSYIEPELYIFVYDQDGKLKIQTTLDKTMNYNYHSKGFIE